MSAAEVEVALAHYIEVAQSEGVTIVSNAFQVTGGRRGRVIGVCALGAYEEFSGENDPPLGFTDDDALSAEWDAIEAGFDDSGLRRDVMSEEQHPREWYDVGFRLRMRFRPVPASSISTT